MSIKVEPTPNPNAKKFTANSMIFSGNGSVSLAAGQKSEYEILNELIDVEGVDNVFGFQNFITINKKPDAEWDSLEPKVTEVMQGKGY